MIRKAAGESMVFWVAGLWRDRRPLQPDLGARDNA